MIRPAEPRDLEAVYRMGYDTWGDSKPVHAYLKACAESPKYRTGTWYVLEERGRLMSSLIVHRLADHSFGLGSISTPPERRRNGWASQLISGVLSLLDSQGAETIYLHSDIDALFYARFGFRLLPPDLQRRAGSGAMLRCPPALFTSIVGSPGYRAPDYF